MIMILGMEYYGPKLYTVHINDDPGLTLTYFTTLSNLAKLAFVPRYQVSVYMTIGPLLKKMSPGNQLILPNQLTVFQAASLNT